MVHIVVDLAEGDGGNDPRHCATSLRVAERAAVDGLVADLREHGGRGGHDEVAAPNLHHGGQREEQRCGREALADKTGRAQHHAEAADQALAHAADERLVEEDGVDKHCDAGHHKEPSVVLPSLYGVVIEESVLQVIASDSLEGRKAQHEEEAGGKEQSCGLWHLGPRPPRLRHRLLGLRTTRGLLGRTAVEGDGDVAGRGVRLGEREEAQEEVHQRKPARHVASYVVAPMAQDTTYCRADDDTYGVGCGQVGEVHRLLLRGRHVRDVGVRDAGGGPGRTVDDARHQQYGEAPSESRHCGGQGRAEHGEQEHWPAPEAVGGPAQQRRAEHLRDGVSRGEAANLSSAGIKRVGNRGK
mmetsp:Transcript_43806/g.136354  ORF Transcript_43806/g.136354 Transcript_43806/m.136354 type:complete len:356 (-) Transcript_43806:81-1148(-)